MLNKSSDWKKEFMAFANNFYDFPNFNILDAELESF